MNTEERTTSQLAVDRASFGPELDGGTLDACLLYLRRHQDGVGGDAGLNCRLAEALLHGGRRGEAVECCRRALPWADGDPAMLRICAWVFSNCGCHDEAAAAYGALLRLCPDWIEGYRHVSGALAAAGRREEAITAATQASELAPQQAEFARHAGSLLLSAGRAAEAAFYLERAVALRPGNAGIAVDAAEALLRCGRAAEAAQLLRDVADGRADPRLLRVLSAAEMMRGRLDAALDAVDGALAGAPDNAEYHLHRGHLLWRLGDSSGAALAFDRAAALEPGSVELKRARMGFYLAAGLVTEATSVGGELLHRFPDDRPAAEAMLHLLGHRLDAIDGEFVVLNEGGERALRPLRPLPGLFERLRTQRRVIGALIVRETRTRFGDARLGYAWALIEPILHITLLSVMFAVLMHGRPPIGRHFFIFYYTGLIPYHMFVHTSSGMSHAITGNGPLLELPPVTTFDVIAARGLLEMMTDVIVAVALLLAFGAIGVAQMPDDLWGVSMALLATAALGVGCGYVNAVLTVFFRSWEKAYNQLIRVLYFISGIFYMPDARGILRLRTS